MIHCGVYFRVLLYTLSEQGRCHLSNKTAYTFGTRVRVRVYSCTRALTCGYTACVYESIRACLQNVYCRMRVFTRSNARVYLRVRRSDTRRLAGDANIDMKCRTSLSCISFLAVFPGCFSAVFEHVGKREEGLHRRSLEGCPHSGQTGHREGTHRMVLDQRAKATA